MKNIINRIKISRKSLKHNYETSFEVLENNIRNANDLNTYLEKMKASIKLRREARKHLVITSVSNADIFLKLLALDLIESFIGGDDDIERELRKYTFNLSDILELETENVKVSEIVYADKSFYDLNQIERYFSSLIGLNKD